MTTEEINDRVASLKFDLAHMQAKLNELVKQIEASPPAPEAKPTIGERMIEANNYGLTIREQGGSGLVFDLGLANSHIPAAARKILVRYIDAACLACIAVFRSECAKQFESAHMSSQTSVGFDRIIAIDAQAILREAGAK